MALQPLAGQKLPATSVAPRLEGLCPLWAARGDGPSRTGGAGAKGFLEKPAQKTSAQIPEASAAPKAFPRPAGIHQSAFSLPRHLLSSSRSWHMTVVMVRQASRAVISHWGL